MDNVIKRMAIWPRVAGAGVLALSLLVTFSARASAMGATYNISGFPLTDVAQVAARDATQAAAPLGLVIIATDADGPAAQAGIQRGDILLQVGDVAIDTTATLYAQLQAATPGDEVTVVVQHGDEERTLDVTLGEVAGRAYLGVHVADAQFEPVAIPAVPVHAPNAPYAGEAVTVTVAAVDDGMLAAAGLMVVEVMADAPAAQAGVVPGDRILAVDGKDVTEPEALVDALAAFAPGDTVTLTVQRGVPPAATSEEIAVTLGAAPDDDERAYLGVRVVTLPPAVNIHAVPAGPFTAPAIPVMPGAAPSHGYGYGYAEPAPHMGTPYMGTPYMGAPYMMMPHDGSACGTGGVTIEQHFYGVPGTAAPLPSAAPAAPQSYSQPAVPLQPYAVHTYGFAPEAVSAVAPGSAVTAAAPVPGRMVVLWRSGIPALAGTVEGNVVVSAVGDGMSWQRALPQMGHSVAMGYGVPMGQQVEAVPAPGMTLSAPSVQVFQVQRQPVGTGGVAIEVVEESVTELVEWY